MYNNTYIILSIISIIILYQPILNSVLTVTEMCIVLSIYTKKMPIHHPT